MKYNALAVFGWVTKNGLEPNVRKTNAMIFGSNVWISYVQQTKNFGLLIIPTLN